MNEARELQRQRAVLLFGRRETIHPSGRSGTASIDSTGADSGRADGGHWTGLHESPTYPSTRQQKLSGRGRPKVAQILRFDPAESSGVSLTLLCGQGVGWRHN